MSKSSIDQIQAEISRDFKDLKTWEQKYKQIIQLGKNLKSLPEEEKSDDLKVKGCQSQVWLKADLNADKKIVFQADSDALIVKGLVALLLKVFSEQSPEEILKAELFVVKEIGLDSHLSASRANGLQSMIKQIKYYASAYKYLIESQA